MQNFIQQLNSNVLYQKFLSFLKLLENDLNRYIAWIVLFFILAHIQGKLAQKNAADAAKNEKNKKLEFLQKVLNFITIAVLFIILIVSYNRFLAPTVNQIWNEAGKKENTTTPNNNIPKNTSPSQDTTETQGTTPGQSTPTYQAPKQLYYSVSCSSCWTNGCPNNGYSYGGYQEYYYVYYYNLCKACNCNNFRAQSLWR